MGRTTFQIRPLGLFGVRLIANKSDAAVMPFLDHRWRISLALGFQSSSAPVATGFGFSAGPKAMRETSIGAGNPSQQRV